MKPIEQAIHALGGLTELGRAVGVSPQIIQNWKVRGVPADRCPDIEKATGGKVKCEDLRPDVAWHVLRGT